MSVDKKYILTYMKQLFILFNVSIGINLKPVLVKEAHHSGVGGSLFAGVVKGSTSRCHSPGLVGDIK